MAGYKMKSTKIPSKPTDYNGVTYRSQLEARWAVFFDSLFIRHEYEPEWMEVEAGMKVVSYKPDFYLPDLNLWVEIKPQIPKDIEITKAAGWAEEADILVLFQLSPPTETSQSGWLFHWGDKIKKAILNKQVWWCECPVCKKIQVGELGEPTCGCIDYEEQISPLEEWDQVFGTNITPKFEKTPKLLAAFKAARNFKFD